MPDPVVFLYGPGQFKIGTSLSSDEREIGGTRTGADGGIAPRTTFANDSPAPSASGA
jgi:hypothetical protein